MTLASFWRNDPAAALRGLANWRAFLAGRLRLGEQPRVERRESRLLHIDFAAHLEHGGRAVGQRRGNVGDRADIGGDVLADLAVAARQRLDQPAPLVAQRAGQPVDLGLGGEHDRLVLRQVQEPPHPPDEIAHLLVVERIVEAEHRPRMRHFGQVSGGRRADLHARRIGADELRKRRLDRRVAPHQRVVIGVGNLRRVVGVIEPVVMRDLRREPFELGGGVGIVGGKRGGHGISYRGCARRSSTAPIRL